MPKKPPRNSFYFFMVDFREEQRKRGVTYANMGEVSQAAGPLWTSAEPEVRLKFEAMAKEEKAKARNPLTSTGVPLSTLEAMERERQQAAEAEQQDIIHFVKLKSVNESILDEDIFVMDVNSYCKARGVWVVGEFTLLRFTLRQGIKDSYHELINPGIPYAYTQDMKEGSKEFSLPMPDESSRRTDYIQIFANVVDYLTKGDGCSSAQKNKKHLPPVYTLPDKVAQCLDFLMLLCSRAGEKDTQLRVYQLHTLFYQLVRQISPPHRKDERFPKESLALTQLKRDSTFKYSSGLACEMHEEADRSVVCSSNRAMSWAFTVLEMTCALLDVPPRPGRHLPADECTVDIITTKDRHMGHSRNDDRSPPPRSHRSNDVATADMDRDLSHKKPSSTNAEEKRRSHVPLRMPKQDLSYNNNKSVSSNCEERKRSHVPLKMPEEDLSCNEAITNAEDQKRSHVPLRMPKQDYSMSIRAAPNLSASENRLFPVLDTRGRGRRLASIINRMKL